MFTANVAGSAGSHLRSDVPHRDSNSHSRHNLHDIDRDSTTEEENRRFLRRPHADGGGGDPEDWRRGRRMKMFLEDYKTWGYMACVGIVVGGAIVIIILAATGVISTSRES